MNKILVVVSFVFVSFLSCTGLTDRQRLANQILSDTNLLKVDSMARATSAMVLTQVAVIPRYGLVI